MSVVARRNLPTPSKEDKNHYFWCLWCIKPVKPASQNLPDKFKNAPKSSKLRRQRYYNPQREVLSIPVPNSDLRKFPIYLPLCKKTFLVRFSKASLNSRRSPKSTPVQSVAITNPSD